MKYNLSQIMRRAWSEYRYQIKHNSNMSFGEALKWSWNIAKADMAEAIAAEKKGARRMSYAEYKTEYAGCQTEEGSYDKKRKTIVVYTKMPKTYGKYSVSRTRNGLCPFCNTWCYGDCRAH